MAQARKDEEMSAPQNPPVEETLPPKKLILIDVPHGTKWFDSSRGRYVRDTGTGDGGLGSGKTEDQMVTPVCHALAGLLRDQGHDVRLSHEKVDYTLDLSPSARGRWARNIYRYDIFISPHLDGSSNPKLNGTSAFYPTEDSSRSKALADFCAKRISEAFGTSPTSAYGLSSSKRSKVHSTKLGVFFGGSNYLCPGALCLTEAMFMTNPTELEKILDPTFTERYAKALALGIYDFLGYEAPGDWKVLGEQVPDEGDVDEPLPWTPSTMVMLGDTGELVKKAQKYLNEQGVVPKLDVDGDFGPVTLRAVLWFQAANNLEADGIVGPKTWDALLTTPSTDSPDEGTPSNPPTPSSIGEKALREAFIYHSMNILERPDGSNKGGPAAGVEDKYSVNAIQKKWFPNAGQHWCAMFVARVFEGVGYTPDMATWMLPAVRYWREWAKKNGYFHSASGFTPKPGDIFLIRGDTHIGMVEKLNPDGTITTIEGNYKNRVGSGIRPAVGSIDGYIRIKG